VIIRAPHKPSYADVVRKLVDCTVGLSEMSAEPPMLLSLSRNNPILETVLLTLFSDLFLIGPPHLHSFELSVPGLRGKRNYNIVS
jgi:hypothetical protein